MTQGENDKTTRLKELKFLIDIQKARLLYKINTLFEDNKKKEYPQEIYYTILMSSLN